MGREPNWSSGTGFRPYCEAMAAKSEALASLTTTSPGTKSLSPEPSARAPAGCVIRHSSAANITSSFIKNFDVRRGRRILNNFPVAGRAQSPENLNLTDYVIAKVREIH